ncbi:MAG: response regulator transcription factor [Actinobacteria bacterium]|nr:response regulator transcription factor [Actinomycetota bacterium]
MKVLVIEDDQGLSRALERGLAAEGFSVEVSPDGEDGLWRATEFSYDVVICDIMLPRRTGYQVCATLRERGVWTPILMLTAKDGDLDEAEALDTGADDYLTKPFSFVVLVARLRALMRRGARARPVVLRAGDLWLDPISHRAGREGNEVRLTAREFSLLEYLLNHPGEAVTKQDILDHVWASDFDGDPNIVEVYVGYLRKKLDAPFARHAIETVRGVGYRLDPQGG